VASAAVARFGRVDVLLHLAGGFRPGAPIGESSLSDLQQMLEVNLLSTFGALRAFVPRLTANGWGRIVAVSSTQAQQPAARVSAYAASKAAMEALMLSVTQEVKAQGVTANVVVVRTIDTPAAREAAPRASTAGWTTPEEIAAAMLYLCSDEAGVVNGARIPLYGRG
jgi:NAD(P)-dependent dehydrogenase (short-subunit alcohol dehydrogenase family)